MKIPILSFFENDQGNNFHIIERTKLDNNWFILKENNWKLLDISSQQKIKIFLERMNYQDYFINLDNDDTTFNFIQNIIKTDLDNFLNANLSQYFEKIYSKYSKINFFENNDYNDNKIEAIIKNENIEFFIKI